MWPNGMKMLCQQYHVQDERGFVFWNRCHDSW